MFIIKFMDGGMGCLVSCLDVLILTHVRKKELFPKENYRVH